MSTKTVQHFPGHISMQTHDGAWPGAKAVYFLTTRGFNRFFVEKPGEPGHGHLVVHAEPRPWFFGLIVGWSVLYTNQQSEEDREDMLIVTREVEAKLDVIRRKRAEYKEEEAKVKLAAEEEVKRLANVGRRYEDQHAHMKTFAPSDDQYKAIKSMLASGDPNVMFTTKEDAFKAGYVQGHKRRDSDVAALQAALDKAQGAA